MAVAEDHRDQLGEWITWRLCKGVESYSKCTAVDLQECEVLVGELREQWAAQHEAQLSVKACKSLYTFIISCLTTLGTDAPAHLTKQLNNILTLQSDLDTLNRAIGRMHVALKENNGTSTDEATEALDSLLPTHEQLKSKVDVLYGTLNVPDDVIGLHNKVNIKFIHTLVLAQDLKVKFNF
jgi:hypothetical protein